MVNEYLDPEEANQRRALDIYLESATPDNNFKPKSCVKISEDLYTEGFENCSKSQVNRWIGLFNFKKRLDEKIELAYISTDSKEISTKVRHKSTQDIAERLKTNGELTDDLYFLVRCFIEDAQKDIAANKRIDKDRMKIIKDLLVLTTTREDKLLDRFANQGGDKLSSEDLKAEFAQIELHIEDEDGNVIDVEIDDE